MEKRELVGLSTSEGLAGIEKPSEIEDSADVSGVSRSISPTGVPSTCKTRHIHKIRMVTHVRPNTEDGRVKVR